MVEMSRFFAIRRVFLRDKAKKGAAVRVLCVDRRAGGSAASLFFALPSSTANA